MKQYVSLNKRSKKAQKEYYDKQSLTWGGLNPVPRSVPSGKTYNRKKDKQERQRVGREFRDGFDADFLFDGLEYHKACFGRCESAFPVVQR